jgi:hypothetical protein
MKKKEIKINKNWKGKTKLWFANEWYSDIYLENPEESVAKLIEITEFGKLTAYHYTNKIQHIVTKFKNESLKFAIVLIFYHCYNKLPQLLA